MTWPYDCPWLTLLVYSDSADKEMKGAWNYCLLNHKVSIILYPLNIDSIYWHSVECGLKLWKFSESAQSFNKGNTTNQSILKEISPSCSLEGLMLKVKLQYFGHHIRRVDSWKRLWCWEGLGVGREGDDRGWDGWMASPTRWAWVWVNSGSWWWTGRPGVLRFMGLQRVGHDWASELNWTESILPFYIIL